MSTLSLDSSVRVSVPWGEFAEQAPELAAFGAVRLGVLPAYLATVGESGVPRVHPVTPIIAEGRLFVFMEPTSPKGHDIARRGVYALHCLVPDAKGTGGEFYVRGTGERIDDQSIRVVAAQAASYEPHDRYVLFELRAPVPHPTSSTALSASRSSAAKSAR